MSDELISLEEVVGEEPPPAVKPQPPKLSSNLISVEDVVGEEAATASPAKSLIEAYNNLPVNKFVNEQIIKPIGNLLSSVLLAPEERPAEVKEPTALKQFGTKAAEVIEKAGTQTLQDLNKGNLDRPLTGAIKALTAGGAELVETANTGINFLANMARGQDPREAFDAAKETEESTLRVTQIVEGIAKVNLAPQNEVEASMQELLSLLPESVFAVGEDVYQRSGSILLAAGVESFGTLLTLKPSIAGKIIGKTPVAIEGLAAKDPKAARQLSNHVKEADASLAKELDKKIEKTEKLSPEQAEALGEKIVEAGFKKVGETPEGKPRVRAEEKPAKPKTAEEQIKANELRIQEIERQLKEKAAQDTIAQRKIEEGLSQTAREVSDTALKSTEPTPPAVEKPAPITLDPVYSEAKKIVEAAPDESISKLKEELGLDDAKAAQIVEQVQKENKPVPESEDPVLYREETGEAVTQSKAVDNFTIYESGIPIPGADFIVGKMKAYFNEIQRLIAPETLGPKAKLAAAMTAKNIAAQMRSDVFYAEKSKGRRTFWEKNTDKVADFIKKFETGNLQRNPVLQAADYAYAAWNKRIYAREKQLGIKYDPVDNYLYHVFEDSGGVAQFFERKYGPRWNEPGFVKDRAFKMYEAAEAAGFKPKFKNPEDIMLARQHASDVAEMRIQTLNDLNQYGLAKEITKGDSTAPDGWNAVKWKSPNGKKYWVHDHAAQILHNAFETKTLWNAGGILGDAFRGAMFLKNIMVSTLLSLSGFHALHVLTLDNATNMVRASKESLSGKKNPISWMADFIQANLYGSKGIPLKALYDNPAYGGRLIKAYEGKIDPAQLTAAEKQLMTFMTEGGFIPHLSAQYKTTAIENFKKAIREQSPIGAAKATLWSPFAALQLLQKPMMEVWIPRLKAASYAKDIQTAIKTDPTLLQDTPRRIEVFHKLAKSIDNRYGEMAYNTLFWNRTIKDIGVANTLSLGWQLGFLREYGGGMMDVGQFMKPGSSITQKVKTGLLDRPMFLTFYTSQSLLYGGLMTYLLSGQLPETIEDYIFPKNGETNPDGTPQRVSTMYYVKEFASIAKRIQIEGVAAGLTHVVESKASGVVGAVSEWITGLNSMGQEIRDPNAPAYDKVQQALSYTLQRMEPISAKAIRESDRSLKSSVLGIAGFSPAPKYIAESVIEGKIKKDYQKYNTGKQVPYEKFLLSSDRRELERLYEAGEMEKYDQKLEQVIDKFKLTEKEQVKLTRNIGNKGESNPSLTMFKSLPWQRQKVLLDQMTTEERELYLPVSNKDHLRFDYEPPEAEE